MADYRIVPCSDCAGSGVIGKRIWVYEHGCGFGHYDTDELPCPVCDGEGVVEIEVGMVTLDDLNG